MKISALPIKLTAMFLSAICVSIVVDLPRSQAGVITGATLFSGQAGTGPGVGLVSVPVVVTAIANNDNVGLLNNNITVAVKRFDQLGYIDIQFEYVNSGGVTEYELFEAVDNNTGSPWSRYQMQLGHGVGNSFTPSLGGDGLDFDDPDLDPAPTSTAFTTVATAEDQLTFSGGLHAAGLQTYRVRIDVPDAATPGAGGTFTLRQIPTPIPEPATAALSILAAAGILARRWRR